ncbi:MAG: hypothetical protein AAB595_00800 [Patescibacteria group bacterium]
MTEKLQQTIKEEVLKLPKETQEAINTFDWGSMAEEIGKKYLLSESEINDFQVETLLVLVGLEDGNLYALNIENNVGTSKDEAIKITGEVNQKIFTPISNLIEENIKKNLKNKNPSPEQTLNFILSGGNYSAFIEESENQPFETSETSTNLPTPKSIKDNLVI